MWCQLPKPLLEVHSQDCGHHGVLVDLDHAAEQLGQAGGPADSPASHHMGLGKAAERDCALALLGS